MYRPLRVDERSGFMSGMSKTSTTKPTNRPWTRSMIRPNRTLKLQEDIVGDTVDANRFIFRWVCPQSRPGTRQA